MDTGGCKSSGMGDSNYSAISMINEISPESDRYVENFL